MHKLLKVDNIMYFVKDLNKSALFYQQILGLKQVWRDDMYKMIGFVLNESDAEVVIHADESLPKFDYSYLVADVEKFCESFKQAGYSVSFGPIDVRPGKYAILLDPDGNTIPIIDLTKMQNMPE